METPVNLNVPTTTLGRWRYSNTVSKAYDHSKHVQRPQPPRGTAYRHSLPGRERARPLSLTTTVAAAAVRVWRVFDVAVAETCFAGVLGRASEHDETTTLARQEHNVIIFVCSSSWALVVLGRCLVSLVKLHVSILLSV